MSARPTPVVPEDRYRTNIKMSFKQPVFRLLAEVVDKHKVAVWNIHKHDSLLENKVGHFPCGFPYPINRWTKI